MNKYFFTLIIMLSSLSVFSQDEKLEIEGAIQLGNSDDPTPEAGTVRWNGSDFEGFNGSDWVSEFNRKNQNAHLGIGILDIILR
jgi:hypothetical protein